MNETEMHETIRGLYQGIFDAQAWQRSLTALCDASGSVHASLLVLDTEHGRVLVNQVVNPVPEEVAAYVTHYRAIDPGLPFARRLDVGNWYIDKRDPGEEAMRRSPFCGEFLQNFELSSVMACLIERQATYEVYLSLQRPAGHQGYSDEDARALDWVIPHLREAMALRHRSQEAAVLGHVSAGLLDRLPFAVMVFAETGKPLLTNHAGESWVRLLLPAATTGAGDAPVANGRTSNGWRLTRPFPEVLRAACDPGTLQPAHAIQALGADGRTAQVVVLPLAPARHLDPGWEVPTVLVAVYESNGAPLAITAVLRDLYGLTPAETRLATLLTTGIGLPDACAQLGIKRETSRTQLKAIFTKTGTSTQAQLAHLLTRLGIVSSGQPYG